MLVAEPNIFDIHFAIVALLECSCMIVAEFNVAKVTLAANVRCKLPVWMVPCAANPGWGRGLSVGQIQNVAYKTLHIKSGLPNMRIYHALQF
jgi:hypothetical protein